MEQNRCAICGAIISDNNISGVGFGCMKNVVEPAIKETMWEVYGLNIWQDKVEMVKKAFLDAYSAVKFRNEFKRGFYESMQKAERVSKKQLEIMQNMLADKGICLSFKDIFENYELKVKSGECSEQYRANLEKHKRLYLSGRKNQKED